MADQELKAKEIFLMDGSEHTKGDRDCCGHFGKECKCGGILHYQPVYGGFFYKCDNCARVNY